jgi:hypothetical protein
MPICVTGMYGSGTSMVAEVLQAGGVAPAASGGSGQGDEDGAPDALVAVSHALIGAAGGGWDMPPAIASEWELMARAAPLRARAAEVVRQVDAHEPWVWVDPAASLTLPFWRRLLSPLTVVICVRSPIETVESLTRSTGMSSKLALSLWTAYNRKLVEALGDGQPCVVTHYESFLFDPAKETRRVLEALGVSFDDEVLERIARVPSADRRRHSAPTGRLLADAPEEVVNLYGRLCAAAGPQLQVLLDDETLESASPSADDDGEPVLGALEALAVRHELAETTRARAAAETSAEALGRQLADTQARFARREKALRRSRDRWRNEARGSGEEQDPGAPPSPQPVEVQDAGASPNDQRLEAELRQMRAELDELRSQRPAASAQRAEDRPPPAPSTSESREEARKLVEDRDKWRAEAKRLDRSLARSNASLERLRRLWGAVPRPLKRILRPVVSPDIRGDKPAGKETLSLPPGTDEPAARE